MYGVVKSHMRYVDLWGNKTLSEGILMDGLVKGHHEVF